MIFYSALSNIIWLSTWRIHYLHILLHYNMYLHHAVIFKWLMNINLIADFVVQFRFKSPIVDHFQGYKVPIINTFCLEDFSKSASSNLFYQGKMVLVMYKRLRFSYVIWFCLGWKLQLGEYQGYYAFSRWKLQLDEYQGFYAFPARGCAHCTVSVKCYHYIVFGGSVFPWH